MSVILEDYEPHFYRGTGAQWGRTEAIAFRVSDKRQQIEDVLDKYDLRNVIKAGVEVKVKDTFENGLCEYKILHETSLLRIPPDTKTIRVLEGDWLLFTETRPEGNIIPIPFFDILTWPHKGGVNILPFNLVWERKP